MGISLKDRLRLVRELEGKAAAAPKKRRDAAAGAPGKLLREGWVPSGSGAVRRSVVMDFAPPLSAPLPGGENLPVIIPDLFRYFSGSGAEGGLRPESLRFFDLETTGLSTAAGTAAFLAAFGRFLPPGGEGGSWRLRIDQHLLLDFPGEPDFLRGVGEEFRRDGDSPPPLFVSYNGKTFDAPILRNRFLMQGMAAPEYHHADLLHPARRLWRGTLPSCSQAVIETEILGISRDGDVSGAEAPGIWFDFLDTGSTEGLRLVCDHNIRDISGLASLFAALAVIAARPLEAAEQYRCNLERLALHYRRLCRQGCCAGETAAALLDRAAALGYPRAINARAIETEWRERDPAKALAMVDAALALETIPLAFRESLSCRRERLLRKTGKPRGRVFCP